MYAIISSGGKQYRVAPGDTIRVEKLAGEIGSEVELPGVLAVFGDDATLKAGSELGEAKIRGAITGEGRGKKILVFKFKRKKQYKKTIGHRQSYSEIKVSEIVA